MCGIHRILGVQGGTPITGAVPPQLSPRCPEIGRLDPKAIAAIACEIRIVSNNLPHGQLSSGSLALPPLPIRRSDLVKSFQKGAPKQIKIAVITQPNR